MNNNLQVIPNNEYYQNFSYSLSSRVPYQDWNGPVSDLNHTSGFAKFADYQLESKETDEGDVLLGQSTLILKLLLILLERVI